MEWVSTCLTCNTTVFRPQLFGAGITDMLINPFSLMEWEPIKNPTLTTSTYHLQGWNHPSPVQAPHELLRSLQAGESVRMTIPFSHQYLLSKYITIYYCWSCCIVAIKLFKNLFRYFRDLSLETFAACTWTQFIVVT